MLAVEGFFILLIVIYALSSGITDLLSGVVMWTLDQLFIMLYSLLLQYTAYYLYVRRINKSLQSNLIKFDNVSWYVDALLEAAILISFVVATMLEGTAYAEWAAYIDPIVLIVLAVQMLPSAIHIIVRIYEANLGVGTIFIT